MEAERPGSVGQSSQDTPVGSEGPGINAPFSVFKSVYCSNYVVVDVVITML